MEISHKIKSSDSSLILFLNGSEVSRHSPLKNFHDNHHHLPQFLLNSLFLYEHILCRYFTTYWNVSMGTGLTCQQLKRVLAYR